MFISLANLFPLLEDWQSVSRGSIWAITLSKNVGNITKLGNIQYYEEIKQGNNLCNTCWLGNEGNIGNIGI